MICFYFKCLVSSWVLRPPIYLRSREPLICVSFHCVPFSFFPLFSEQPVRLRLLICCLHPVLSTSGVICCCQHGHPQTKQYTCISTTIYSTVSKLVQGLKPLFMFLPRQWELAWGSMWTENCRKSELCRRLQLVASITSRGSVFTTGLDLRWGGGVCSTDVYYVPLFPASHYIHFLSSKKLQEKKRCKKTTHLTAKKGTVGNWTRPDNIILSVSFWWPCAHCSLNFPFLADRSKTWCDLLLWVIRPKV